MSANSGAIQRFGRRIRFRLLWIFFAFGVGASLTWYWHEAIFRLLFVPAGGRLSPFGGLPVYTDPTAMLGATIGLAMKGGLVVALPVAVFAVFGLVAPLLSPERRRFIWLFLPAIFLCYLGGAAFTYFVMLPTGMRFLLSFGTNVAVPMITITSYMKIVTALIFWVGLVFEIPLIMYLLAKTRLVPRKKFVRFRKYLPVAALFLSAIITPSFDVVNQTLVAVPIVVLFEVGLFLAWLAEGGPKKMGRKIKAVAASIVRRPCGWTRRTVRCLRLWRNS